MAYHRIDQAAVQALLRNPRGGIARDFQRRGQRILTIAQAEIGVHTGTGRRSLHVRQLPPPHVPGVEIGSPLQSVRHHLRGHGVIRPRRARALRFVPKGAQRPVFTMRVGPLAGNPFLQRALRRGARG